MVVFGRPKGDRGSYRQWQEDNILPQVVFEILSPGNRLKEMAKKLDFYEQYGVEEYYIYDPERFNFTGYRRIDNQLVMIDSINNWVSPRLQIHFVLQLQGLEIYTPQGNPFLTTLEFAHQAEQERERAKQEQKRAEQEREWANVAESEVARLKALLKQAGINEG